MNFKILCVTISQIFLLILFLSDTDFLMVNASSESTDIIQIPSEATDFPENNQETLEILFSKATSSSDSVHVIGSIKNTGPNTLKYVDVTAHFFDENNQTVGVTTCCNADPKDIEPGHTSSFDSFSSSDQMSGEPRYFRLSFDWQDTGSNNYNPEINIPGLNTNIPCNNISTDFKLTSNLDCSSDGLNIVNQNGLSIDLNGYTISGPGFQDENAGIRLVNSSDILITGPGTIKGFQFGVLDTQGDGNKISRVTFTENKIGMFDVKSTNTIIEDNLLFGNSIGFAVHSSTGAAITTNLLKSNGLAGINLINSSNNEIQMNTIQGSATGVFLDGQSAENIVNSNSVLQNIRVDLNNGNGLSEQASNNEFSDNNCNTSIPDGLCLAG